jgi:UDP-N-acetylmuramoylalanine--D-glutamate ligase
MEFVENKKSFLIIDDSKATNPNATLKALNSIKRDVILIAGGQDRNADFSSLVPIIEKKVKTLILIGETADKIASLFNGSKLKIIRVKTMEAAAQIGADQLTENKALLLSPACPSWDMYSSYKERGNIFQESIKKNIN